MPLAVCDDKRGQNHQVVNCGAVVGVAAVAAVASYEHAYDLVRLHGEAAWTARLGIAATLAANAAHGRVVEHGNNVTSSQGAASAAFRAARRRFATYRSGRTEFPSNASSGPASAQDVVAGCVTDGRVLAAAHAWWPDEVAGASL